MLDVVSVLVESGALVDGAGLVVVCDSVDSVMVPVSTGELVPVAVLLVAAEFDCDGTVKVETAVEVVAADEACAVVMGLPVVVDPAVVVGPVAAPEVSVAPVISRAAFSSSADGELPHPSMPTTNTVELTKCADLQYIRFYQMDDRRCRDIFRAHLRSNKLLSQLVTELIVARVQHINQYARANVIVCCRETRVQEAYLMCRACAGSVIGSRLIRGESFTQD
jgi:hypothetical protein